MKPKFRMAGIFLTKEKNLLVPGEQNLGASAPALPLWSQTTRSRGKGRRAKEQRSLQNAVQNLSIWKDEDLRRMALKANKLILKCIWKGKRTSINKNFCKEKITLEETYYLILKPIIKVQ